MPYSSASNRFRRVLFLGGLILFPMNVAACDAKWIEVCGLSAGSAISGGNGLVASKNLTGQASAFFVPVESEALSIVCCMVLLLTQGKRILGVPREFLVKLK